MAKIKTKKTSGVSDDLIVASIMNASLAIAELDDVVSKFEQAGGRERFAGNKSWLPFLEAVDSLQKRRGSSLVVRRSCSRRRLQHPRKRRTAATEDGNRYDNQTADFLNDATIGAKPAASAEISFCANVLPFITGHGFGGSCSKTQKQRWPRARAANKCTTEAHFSQDFHTIEDHSITATIFTKRPHFLRQPSALHATNKLAQETYDCTLMVFNTESQALRLGKWHTHDSILWPLRPTKASSSPLTVGGVIFEVRPKPVTSPFRAIVPPVPNF